MVWTEIKYFCSYCNCNITNMTCEGRFKHECKCKGQQMANETIKKIKEYHLEV